MDEKPKHDDLEREATIDDLEVPSQDAAKVVGGQSNVSKTREQIAKTFANNAKG